MEQWLKREPPGEPKSIGKRPLLSSLAVEGSKITYVEPRAVGWQ